MPFCISCLCLYRISIPTGTSINPTINGAGRTRNRINPIYGFSVGAKEERIYIKMNEQREIMINNVPV